MSDQLPFKKDNSKYGRHESSDLSKMSEHLRDSNILQSRRTYGRQEKDQRLSMSSECNESPFVEELYAEENSESTTSSCYYKNNNNQKGINSEFSLFNDEDMDYYFSVPADSSKQHSSLLSIPEASSSRSNYLRVRKNLKNQVSNQQYSFEPILYEKNLNYVAAANESKSASNFSNLNQATLSDEQNSHLSITNQSNHTKINDVKSNDAYINKLPQNSSISQMVKQAKIPDNGTAFQNPLKNSSFSTNPFSIVDLVKRFSVGNNQAHGKNKDCKSTPAKKMSVVKRVTSSKINSFNKKTLNSRVSIKKPKNFILKSNMMSTQIRDTKINSGGKISVVKTPSKSVQKGNIRSTDNVEINVAKDCVNDTDALKKVYAKILSKAEQKEHARSVDSVKKRSIDMIGSINNLGELGKGGAKTPLKTVLEGNNESVPKKKLCRNKATTKIECRSSSNHGAAKKIHSDDGDKQVVKPSLILRNENAVQSPELPLPPTSLEGACEATPLCTWKIIPSAADNHSIQNDNQAVSIRNVKDLVIPRPSNFSNNHSSKNESEYDMQNVFTSNSNNPAYNSTTIYTCKNTSTDITNCSTELKSEHYVSPQTFQNSDTFEAYLANFFAAIRNNCILNFQDYSAKILTATTTMNPSLRNCDMTLNDFCLIPAVTDVYGDLIKICDLNKPETTLDSNKGYDFPENFAAENLLRLIKDYVFTTCSYLIPQDAKANTIMSYSEIVDVAMRQMSKNELTFLLFVFGNSECSFNVNEVLSRLGHVALLVMYCEYKSRQNLPVKT